MRIYNAIYVGYLLPHLYLDLGPTLWVIEEYYRPKAGSMENGQTIFRPGWRQTFQNMNTSRIIPI